MSRTKSGSTKLGLHRFRYPTGHGRMDHRQSDDSDHKECGYARNSMPEPRSIRLLLLRDLSNVPCMGASIVRMCSH